MKDQFDILIDNLERKLDRSLYDLEVEAVRGFIDLYLSKFEKMLLYGEPVSKEVQKILGKHTDCWIVDEKENK